MPNQLVNSMPIENSQPQESQSTSTIESWVRAHHTYLHRIAHSILDDTHEAEDAVQETFLAANRAIENYRGQSSPRTWLTRITINICRGRLRKRTSQQNLKKALQTIYLTQNQPQSPEEIAVDQESHRQLWGIVDSLAEKHRIPLILRYVQELSVEEIALILGIPEGTVHSRLYYARRWLQTRLGDRKDSDERTVK